MTVEQEVGRVPSAPGLRPFGAEPVSASQAEPLVPRAEGVCMDCGGVNPVWFAPNYLWNFVIGGPGARGDPGGFYCPSCFIKRAEAAGICATAWLLTPEVHHG